MDRIMRDAGGEAKTPSPNRDPLPRSGGVRLYASVMTLSSDEHEILRRVAESPEPVAPSGFFHEIHPPDFPPAAPEGDPQREAWQEKQIGLYGAMLRLHEMNFLRVVHPANGERGDLVEATQDARTVL